MYSLDGHNLADFGIIAGQSDSSNIALAGCWDMPVRTGKTHHEWDEVFEPYLRADEIFFAGRDLEFTFLLKAESKAAAINQLYSFFDLLGTLTELKDLVTPHGSFEVYVKKSIDVDYLEFGWCKGKLTFRQPIIDLTGDELTADNQHPSLDNISLKSIGAFVQQTTGDFARPATIDANQTAYGAERFSIKRRSSRSIALKLFLHQPSYALFNSAIKSLSALLASPNSRILNKDGKYRECFAKDGFKVSGVQKIGDAFYASIDLTLTEIRVLTNYKLLADHEGNILTLGKVPLAEIIKQQ